MNKKILLFFVSFLLLTISAESAFALTNGVCGTAYKQILTTKPTTGLCYSGTASYVTTAGSTWYWFCRGISGGTSSFCYAYKKVADTTPPTISITSPRSGSVVSGTITLVASASDKVGVAGVQFLVDGVNFGAEDTVAPYQLSFDTKTLSNATHTFSAKARDAAGNTRISATSIVIVNNPTPINGVCGSSNNQSFTTIPTTNLCSSGTASTVTGTGPWNWTCIGSNGGTTASCSATKTATVCNTYPGFGMTELISNNLPDSIEFWAAATCPGSGSIYDYPVPAEYSTESCTYGSMGSHCGCSDCIMIDIKLVKTITPTPINGVCGSSNNQSFTTIPTTNLCSSGTASTVTGTGPWNWTRAGSNGGTTASCSATKTVVPQNNLIQNPSFEESDGSNPVNWKTGNWGNNTAIFTYPVAGYNSIKAAKVELTQRVDGDAKWYFNDVPVLPNQEYKFSDNYQSSTQSFVTIQYTLSDNTFQYVDIASLGVSTSWTSMEKTFTTPVNAVSLTIFHLINSVGYLTVDNFNLEKVSNSGGELTQGMISINFDDGWLSAYNNALPILNAKGLKSTNYIITGALEYEEYINASQVLSIQSAGHEIGAHTKTHPDLTQLSSAQLVNEINGSKQDLISLGINQVPTFSYPYGETNSTVTTAVKNAGFIGARIVEPGSNKKTTDKYLLKSESVEVNTSISTIKSWIDSAIQNKTWTILVFHKVDYSGNQYSTTPEIFQQMVDYLVANNILVVTNARGIEILSQ